MEGIDSHRQTSAFSCTQCLEAAPGQCTLTSLLFHCSWLCRVLCTRFAFTLVLLAALYIATADPETDKMNEAIGWRNHAPLPG